VNTFATQPQTQQKALQKALRSPLIGKHGKRKTTLLKEDVYKEIQAKILEKADKLIDAQIKVALTGNEGGPDPRVIEMLFNRVFGRPNVDANTSLSASRARAILDGSEEENKNEIIFTWQSNDPHEKVST